jgi:hypothetical protein
LAARRLRHEHDPEGLALSQDQWRTAVADVAAIYRALEAHGFELVSDTDRRAGMFDLPPPRTIEHQK